MGELRAVIIRDINAIVESDEYQSDMKAEAQKTLETLKSSADKYLNQTGKIELDIKGARLLRAVSKLEEMTDRADIAHQQKIIATIERAYELRFTRAQIAEAQEVIKAQNAVVGFLKSSAVDFAKIAAKIAIKHGIAALKEAI